MGKPTGFMEYDRQDVPHRPVTERVKDYFEVDVPLPEEMLLQQAARCMDCGIPFCHGMGCPLANRIPEFNDLVYRGRWKEACDSLHATNNFPEITGRVCPAPCETACTLNINDEPVLVRHIELQIVERGWDEGYIIPQLPKEKTDKRVAVIGSGPAGLAAAQQLARAGHEVTLFEKDDRIGGLLRYGIPDFKLDKSILDRRLKQLEAEGVSFRPAANIGEDISPKYLRARYDAVLLAMGATSPRDLTIPGRGFENIHFAMDYLRQQNRINAGDSIPDEERINAKDKIVVVIGGGDTGSDCVGTAVRQGARQVHQLEIMPKPPESPDPTTPWPTWPRMLRTSSSQEEGCNRLWSVLTKKLSGVGDRVAQLHGIEVEWIPTDDGRMKMQEVEGSEFTMKVDLVLLAMGFVHVAHQPLADPLGLKYDERGNIIVDAEYHTSERGVFAAGDCASGASLVVHAINNGRQAAAAVNRWLKEQD